jgi:hypothetical protein
MEKLTVQITFIEECLGTTAGDSDLFKTYIASKSPDAETIEEEVATHGTLEVAQKQMTIFMKHKGVPFIYDYMIKGFFKAACQACMQMPKSKSADLKAFRKKIDQLIFVQPREIFLKIPKGEKMGVCQRPLRASTPSGERVALACSESVPAGTSFTITIIDLTEKMEKIIREWLDYGEYNGLLQWRNSGKGRFKWKKV